MDVYFIYFLMATTLLLSCGRKWMMNVQPRAMIKSIILILILLFIPIDRWRHTARMISYFNMYFGVLLVMCSWTGTSSESSVLISYFPQFRAPQRTGTFQSPRAPHSFVFVGELLLSLHRDSANRSVSASDVSHPDANITQPHLVRRAMHFTAFSM